MLNNRPLVTIGIPNFNYARYINKALCSVVNQTYQNIELIIVDDFSKDNSVDLIEKWISDYNGKIKIIFIKNSSTLGISAVCNIILGKAQGKYYQILDADDIILPGKIEMQVRQFENEANCSLVYSNIKIVNEDSEIINDNYLEWVGYNHNKMPQGNVFHDLLLFNFIPNPSVLINTSYAKELGGYDESLQVQDYYMYLKLAEVYPFSYDNSITAYYRIHDRSLSNNNKTNRKSIEGSLKLLSRYYTNGDEKFRARFRKSIFNMAPYFYKNQFETANFWIKRNATLNPGFKSLGYLIAFYLKIPYSFFDKIKSKLHTFNRKNAK